MAQLDRMIDRYDLPEDTRGRVARSVGHLTRFPDSGAPLTGDWKGFRFVLGPWPWLLIIYERIDDDLIGVVSVEDSRSGGAATATSGISTRP